MKHSHSSTLKVPFLLLLVSCGGEDPNDSAMEGGGASTGSGGAGASGSGGAGASGSGGADPGTGGGGSTEDAGWDATSLLECPVGQFACNLQCLSPGESSEGCNYLAWVEESSADIQGVAVHAAGIYLGVLRTGDTPDEVRVYDKSTGALQLSIPGGTGTIQQILMTDTHVGWTSNDSGTLSLYAAPLGSTDASVVYSTTSFLDGSGIASGWLLPESGTGLAPAGLTYVPAGGGEPESLPFAIGDIDRLRIQERGGVLFYVSHGTTDPDVLWSLPLAGGTPSSLLEQDSISAFCADATHLYFIGEAESGTLSSGRGLFKLPLEGGTPELVTQEIPDEARPALVESGDFLYTSQTERSTPGDDETPYRSRLIRIAKATGERTVIAVTNRMHDIHADTSGIYFTHFGLEGQGLMRVDP